MDKRDCHYCDYACCEDEKDEVSCFAEEFFYFSHYVTDSKEAEQCKNFVYNGVFPK